MAEFNIWEQGMTSELCKKVELQGLKVFWRAMALPPSLNAPVCDGVGGRERCRHIFGGACSSS